MDAQRSGSRTYLLFSFHEIENLIPLKEPTDKTRVFWTLLQDQALSYFENHLKRTLEAEDSEIPNNDLELVLRYIGLEYILKRAICVKTFLMRQPSGIYVCPTICRTV
jgi:hypothetical protein